MVTGDLKQYETVDARTSTNTAFGSTPLTPCLYSKNTYTSSQTAVIQQCSFQHSLSKIAFS